MMVKDTTKKMKVQACLYYCFISQKLGVVTHHSNIVQSTYQQSQEWLPTRQSNIIWFSCLVSQELGVVTHQIEQHSLVQSTNNTNKTWPHQVVTFEHMFLHSFTLWTSHQMSTSVRFLLKWCINSVSNNRLNRIDYYTTL